MRVFGGGATGRLEGCVIAGNADCGVKVEKGGDPTLVGCTLRDHAAGGAGGLYVAADARGKASVGARNVFLRNAGGDVVRK